MEQITEKWDSKYPNAMRSWSKNWDAISPIFKFSADVRKVIYTTNAIESLNSTYRRLNRQRRCFLVIQHYLKRSILQHLKPLKNGGYH